MPPVVAAQFSCHCFTSLPRSRRSAPSAAVLRLASSLLRHRSECACGHFPSSPAIKMLGMRERQIASTALPRQMVAAIIWPATQMCAARRWWFASHAPLCPPSLHTPAKAVIDEIHAVPICKSARDKHVPPVVSEVCCAVQDDDAQPANPGAPPERGTAPVPRLASAKRLRLGTHTLAFESMHARPALHHVRDESVLHRVNRIS